MAVSPLSLRGIAGSLRVPTPRDALYSSKAFIASALALAAGFGLDLENPYWSVLTVYIIVNPPGAGAIRSKAIFRLIGTVIGGVLVIAATGLFCDEIGILLTATIAIIVGAMFLNQIDKTPIGYIWFAVAVTAAVIALSNLTEPSRIFDLATARVGEISLGILIMAAVDCIWPEPMTPGFLETMADWRGQARNFLIETIRLTSPVVGDEERRQKLQDLIKGIQVIDSKAIQLPFDVVPRAPRGRDLDLVRHKVVATVAELVAIELRARQLRQPRMDLLQSMGCLQMEDLLGSVTAWMRAEPSLASDWLEFHVERGLKIAGKLEAAWQTMDPTPTRVALLERGILSRLASFLRDWCDLLLALRAVETGRSLPPSLETRGLWAKPVRSVDYVGTALDLAPLTLALTVCSLIWYLTAWNNGPTALLFCFAGCIFLVGQGQILQSTMGLLTCVLIAFGFVFLYQFVILPRVTDFPVLIMVLGCALLPLGLLMAMSMAGMLIAALILSFLGLQNAYAADFMESLQTLIASLLGLLIAVISLRVCAYDHASFAARRLAAAVRRDVLDVARATRLPDPGRYRVLAFYRLSLYFPAAEQVADGGSRTRSTLISELSIGYYLLNLRRQEDAVSPGARKVITALRDSTAAVFQGKRAGQADESALRTLVDRVTRDPAIQSDPAHDVLLDDLTGLAMALGNLAQRQPTVTR